MSTATNTQCFQQVDYHNKTMAVELHLADTGLSETRQLLCLLEKHDGYLIVTDYAGLTTEFKTFDQGMFWIEIWHNDLSGTFTSLRNAQSILDRALLNFGGIKPKEDLASRDIEWLY